ncbi:MAG: flagellar hook-length control protein FliK [Betaproteobacteria bacterium]
MNPIQQARLASFLRVFQTEPVAPLPGRDNAGPALQAGARVDARLVESLPDGRTLIEVEGAIYQTRLPAAALAGPGGRLALTVLQAGPSPTFGLGGTEPSAPPPASSRIDLSGLAARLRGIVDAAAAEAGSTRPAVAEPLLTRAPADAGHLERPLRTALETSGLFYESHQAEWVGGRRDLSSLRAEPQALVHAGTAGAAQALEGSDAVTAAGSSVSAAGSPSADSLRAAPDGSQPMPPALATIVDRQLQTLSSHQIQWSGQLWPGQHADWVIEEDQSGDTASPGEEGESRWTSRLRLALPRVGEVDALLSLRGTGIEVRLQVPAERVAEVRQAFPGLRASLLARGLELQAANVSVHEH